MRITFVSAHYPPNFVSGGTLQPQRLARGLRDRGHDVSRLRRLPRQHAAARWRPGTRTTRPACRCAGSCPTPCMDWADERNYDNPADGRRSSRPTSQRHPADVVHLHALQTLGVGLVEVAKAVRRRHGRHDARLLVGLRPPVPRRSRSTALLPRGRGRRLRLRGRATRTSCDGPSACGEALQQRRPGAGALAIGGRGARAPTASPPTSSTSTRTAWTLPAPGPAAHRRAPTDSRSSFATPAGSNPMKGADVLVEAAHQLGAEPRPADRRPRPRRRRASATVAPLAGHLPRAGARRTSPRSSTTLLAATDVLVLPVGHARVALARHPRGAAARRAGGRHRHPRSRGGRRPTA